MRQRSADLLLVQGFEAMERRCRLLPFAQSLQNLGQAKLGRCMRGTEPQSGLKFSQSLVRSTQFKQDRTQEVVRVGVIRIERRYLLKAFQRFRILRSDTIQDAQRVPDVRILWI